MVEKAAIAIERGGRTAGVAAGVIGAALSAIAAVRHPGSSGRGQVRRFSHIAAGREA